jgi:hypothetical protein
MSSAYFQISRRISIGNLLKAGNVSKRGGAINTRAGAGIGSGWELPSTCELVGSSMMTALLLLLLLCQGLG